MCVGDCSVKVICPVISEKFFLTRMKTLTYMKRALTGHSVGFFPFVNFCRLFITCCRLFVRVYFLPTMLKHISLLDFVGYLSLSKSVCSLSEITCFHAYNDVNTHFSGITRSNSKVLVQLVVL